MKNLIDTHFHLDFYKNHKDLFKEINNLQQYTLCMTNSPEVYEECKRLYFNTKFVKFALGFNPKENNNYKSFELFKVKFVQAKYIGEVGLDFSATYKKRFEEQKYYFEEIVKMCAIYNKLFSVHVRYAEDTAIEILEKYKPKKCIIHWYTGNENQIKRFIELGCYFSINSNMVYNSNKKILLIPKDRILMESDGPFTKVNGKKFEPKLLVEQYKIVSNFLKQDNLVDLIYNNFKQILMS